MFSVIANVGGRCGWKSYLPKNRLFLRGGGGRGKNAGVR